MAGWVALKSGSNTERAVFFSDAVFAIALTLLVVELHPPDVEFGDNAALAAGLLELLTKYIGFGVSFMVIALNWILHHEKFQVIERWDVPLLRANFVVLFFVAFLPFPTAVFSDQPLAPVAITLYTCSVAALSLAQGWVWWLACRRGLVRRDVPADVRRAVATRGIPVVVGFLLVGALSWFVDPWWSLAVLMLLAPVQFVLRRRQRADLERRYPVDEPDTPSATDAPAAPGAPVAPGAPAAPDATAPPDASGTAPSSAG